MSGKYSLFGVVGILLVAVSGWVWFFAAEARKETRFEKRLAQIAEAVGEPKSEIKLHLVHTFPGRFGPEGDIRWFLNRIEDGDVPTLVKYLKKRVRLIQKGDEGHLLVACSAKRLGSGGHRMEFGGYSLESELSEKEKAKKMIKELERVNEL